MGVQLGGDINNDNVVNAVDFALFKPAFGTSCCAPPYDPRADYDGNSVIQTQDFAIMRGNFGRSGVGPSGTQDLLLDPREQRLERADPGTGGQSPPVPGGADRLVREQADGSNPGLGYIRVAMVQDEATTAEALHRLVAVLG